MGPACAPKNGNSGNFTIHNVMCPDESSGVVNDSAYTNSAAGKTQEFCIQAVVILGKSGEIPSTWKEISSAIYLPLSNSLYPEGPVHQEYTGYNKQHLINFVYNIH